MSLLLDALACKNHSRPPIWLMRQAGRYLPEYRKLKETQSLLEMFHNPETIVEVTLQPIRRLKVDAAILFSDILTVLDGLNLRYDFKEGIGPVVFDPQECIEIQNPQAVYAHIHQAITLLKQELQVPLLGFAGAPFTIASYILEQKSSRDLKKTKQLLFQNPHTFHHLLDVITEATIAYLHLQIDAGVEAVQLFDSWANSLNVHDFEQVCLKPMQKIVQAVKARGIPVILFCRGSCLFAEQLASIEPSAISLDWSGDLPSIRKKIPRSIAIQGNLDPMVLYGSKELIQAKVDPLLEQMEEDPGYIFNLGHGILPDIPVENVEFLVNYVQNRSRVTA